MAVNKRLIIILSLVAAVCLAVAGVTVAYYQGQTADVDNQFKVGDVNVSVPEEFPSIDPGNDALKAVRLQNTGTVDAYLRAMIVPTFRGDEGSQACDVDYSTVPSGYIMVTAPDGVKTYKLFLADDWGTSWYFSPTDNVFYHRDFVKKGQTTNLLLQSVVKSGDDWKDLNIDILADAVQTEGETVLDHLKTHWGVTRIGEGTGRLYWE